MSRRRSRFFGLVWMSSLLFFAVVVFFPISVYLRGGETELIIQSLLGSIAAALIWGLLVAVCETIWKSPGAPSDTGEPLE